MIRRFDEAEADLTEPTPRPVGRAVEGRRLLLLAALFAASRAFYFALGVRFNDYPLERYWQYLDPFLLRKRLLESLFYLHGQPPLFNLYLGLALKTGHERAVFIATYLAGGFTVYVTTDRLMRRLGVSSGLALLLSTWLVTSPGFVAYENWLFYAVPETALLTLSALVLLSFLETGRRRFAFAFFGLLLGLCAMRSLFHLAYLVVAAGGLVALARHARRRVLTAALPALALLVALYAKNLVLFGHFGLSTWLGMNLAALTTEALPPAERDSLVARGALDPVSRVPGFSPPEAYPASFFDEAGPPRAKALSWVRKTTGAINYNHPGYIRASEAQLRDALWVIRHRPRVYLRSMAAAWAIYFRSTSDLRFLGLQNLRRLDPLLDTYDIVFFGEWPWDPPADAPARHNMLLVGLPVLALFGVATAPRRTATGRRLTPGGRKVVAWLCFNIVYVALVGNCLELGENNRFRFATDPSSLVLLGLWLETVRRGRTTSPDRAE